jgi:hypothetical protein
VVETGEFVTLTERGRHRPVPLGVSIGHFEGETGTLGFLAKRGNELMAVSNNHVLARTNEATKGDAILQPGLVDGGGANDKFAELVDWITLEFAGGVNQVDAAIARVDDDAASEALYNGGPLGIDPAEPRQNSVVRKCGRTTGATRGITVDVSATIKLRYTRGIALLSDQILIQGLAAGQVFSEAGDSGSLIVDDASNEPVGLLCGGSSQFTVANRIQIVLAELGVAFGR